MAPFCWADLSTHGGAAAVDFYSQLMGWQPETQDSGFGTSYTMFRQDGHAIAGLAWLTREMSEIPSSWNNYVCVDDVDALMPTVTEGGGQIIQPPFDVPDGARIAVILDPDWRSPVSLSAARQHRRRPGQHAGRPVLESALHAGAGGSKGFLQRAAGLGLPGGRDRQFHDPEQGAHERQHHHHQQRIWATCRPCGCPTSPWPTSKWRQSA